MGNQNFRISDGDRIYARINSNGQCLAEMTFDGVRNMREILAAVWQRAAGVCRGMVKLYLRNMTGGGSMEKIVVLASGV